MSTKNIKNPNADLVGEIARQIANQDFRVTMSRYVSGSKCPWVITVGEPSWSTHLVVESIKEDGSDAVLAILAESESEKFGMEINTKNIARTIGLRVLTSDNYMSVRDILGPATTVLA